MTLEELIEKASRMCIIDGVADCTIVEICHELMSERIKELEARVEEQRWEIASLCSYAE